MTITNPDLTVILTSWNAADTVGRAIASVLSETGVDLECIVIDDGSGDGTADIVAAVAATDPRVILIRLQDNGGVSNARNHGLDAARGTWLTFLDADDLLRPGGLAALMRPTADPVVHAVIGQRIWTDGERTWLTSLYDIPDIREPGRKSLATHPGLLYHVSITGKAFRRSLTTDLRFEGRILGDQPWAIRALLRAGDGIEILEETIYEWWRPPADAGVATITSAARVSVRRATEAATVARGAFLAVSAEIDLRIPDVAAATVLKRAYLDRLLRSDLAGPLRSLLDRHDPDVGQLMDAISALLETAPDPIVAAAVDGTSRVLRPPWQHWGWLTPDARRSYWRMVRRVTRADPRPAARLAGGRAPGLGFALVRRFDGPAGPGLASFVLSMAARRRRLLDRGPRRPTGDHD